MLNGEASPPKHKADRNEADDPPDGIRSDHASSYARYDRFGTQKIAGGDHGAAVGVAVAGCTQRKPMWLAALEGSPLPREPTRYREQ